jgi:cysteine desulfurase
MGAEASEIILTSGGTEADNWVLRSAVADLGIRRIVSSRIEHHAVLHTLEALERQYDVGVDYVAVNSSGLVSLENLEMLLSDGIPTLVSLMHVNNEIGTVTDLVAVGNICRKYGALYHADTVQSVGKTTLDLHALPVDFVAASAHKFHGPKGVGFAYVRKGIVLQPLIYGGEQEKGWRAGTESVHNIAGMAKALELSLSNLNHERANITALKTYAIRKMEDAFPGTKVNGGDGFYNILNVCLPIAKEKTAMILFMLDMKGIAVSRGSACQSGSPKPSHVLAEILSGDDMERPSLRISFSHGNTMRDIDALVDALRGV